MQICDFGKRSGLKVPPFSIGAMRFPRDEQDAAALIRHAIDSGMQYIDTCRGYGESERQLAIALKGGYREKVILSTKWCPWIAKIRPDDEPTADCVRRRIDEQLMRLEVDYFDFYQVWNIHAREFYDAAVAKGGMVEGIRRAMDEGLVRHTGFTTHDTPENLMDYLPEVDWAEVVLMTFNLMNTSYRECLQAYHEKGIGTIVMNPLGGGRLAEESEVIQDLAQQAGARSGPELALRYVLAQPFIDTALVGINQLRDVDNAIAAEAAGPLSPEHVRVVDDFVSGRTREAVRFCTGCKYCMPCPQGIDIPAVMTALYDYRHWGMTAAARRRYDGMKTPKADACAECGECMVNCTQHLEIPDQMRKAAEIFAS